MIRSPNWMPFYSWFYLFLYLISLFSGFPRFYFAHHISARKESIPPCLMFRIWIFNLLIASLFFWYWVDFIECKHLSLTLLIPWFLVCTITCAGLFYVPWSFFSQMLHWVHLLYWLVFYSSILLHLQFQFLG